MQILTGFLLLVTFHAAIAHDTPHPSAAAAARMRESAERLIAELPESARAKVLRPFGDPDRLDWHYTPRSRNGVSLKELNTRGREAVHGLLRQALSAAGYSKVVNIIELEIVLRELETFGLMRDPERYHLTIYGTPDRTAPWGWRFEGHHLSLNFTLVGSRMAVDTPSFFGANPAMVPKGPKKGLRALAAEEDEARALLASLTDEQRREAVVRFAQLRRHRDEERGEGGPTQPRWNSRFAPDRAAARAARETRRSVRTHLRAGVGRGADGARARRRH